MISALRVASTWEEVTPATNTATVFSQAAMLTSLLDSLEVEDYWAEGTNVNWLTGVAGTYDSNTNMMTEGTATHCSAFVGSVTELLGVYILRQPQASDILLANNQANWLATNTAGWTLVSNMTTAQHLANAGTLAVASYLNPDPSTPGHIAVLRPSNRTDVSVNEFGPEECQSGDVNYADTNISTGFATPGQFPGEIKYYSHTVTYPVSPAYAVFNQNYVSNNLFVMTASTVVGRSYTVQGSTNLMNWTNLTVFTNSDKSTNFYTNVTLKASMGNSWFYRLSGQ
jgi:hypothetical protein